MKSQPRGVDRLNRFSRAIFSRFFCWTVEMRHQLDKAPMATGLDELEPAERHGCVQNEMREDYFGPKGAF